ncbi:hypothetical protein AB1L30_19215 [Bremerella sp. JC817]|uniref:hypothetical protein n=1 Tax=Bremerella sp. JC817 TaxID=3231756 RepID=UPI0034593D02
MGEDSYAPYLMFFGGIILIIWLLMRRSWKSQAQVRKARKKEGHLVRNPRPAQSQWTMSDGPHELNQWQVEMLERTREFQGLVDTKLLILQRTLVKLEQAASQLPAEERETLRPVVEESEQIVREGSPNFRSVSELLCDDEKLADIYSLADNGSSASEIAQQLDIEVEHVEAVLRLRKN